MENPDPVSLQRSGTGGALAGWYLYPLPFFTCPEQGVCPLCMTHAKCLTRLPAC